MGCLRPLTRVPSSIPTISPLVVSTTTGSATRQDMVSYHQINYADGMYTDDTKAHGLASRVTTISSMTRPRLLRSIGSLQMAMTAGPTSSAGGQYCETDLEVLMLHLLAPSKASLSPSHGTGKGLPNGTVPVPETPFATRSLRVRKRMSLLGL